MRLDRSVPSLVLSLVVASALGAACSNTGGGPFDDVIAFGDSLTDVGNVAGITTPGNAPVIDGYYEETHFSDEILWIERLADDWGLPDRTPGRGSSTSLPAEPDGNTWAWGGSEAGSGTVQPPGVTEPIPNLLAEVREYLTYHEPNPDALYAIWSGANNLLIGGKFGPVAAAEAVASVKTSLRVLEDAGAESFLVFNMPKMGDTPAARSSGIVSEALANEYADAYNAALDVALAELRLDPSFDAAIGFVDVYAELELVVDTVQAGATYEPDFFVPGPPVVIANVTDEALGVFQDTGTYPTDYLFWDDVHPTTQGHQVLAGLVLQAMD
ncbi:MAG: SGNH/GDSL hydrolase family protein [Deltaproteobacteria bacterium]|nr:SGNH/GDSL hydrolase family protein [Deltaproteobacteria bacterium]